LKREQFDQIERSLCDSYRALDLAAHKADDSSASTLKELAEKSLTLYNEFCELSLPLLSESDREELASTRQKTHLLNE
jgi:hypothetical protein